MENVKKEFYTQGIGLCLLSVIGIIFMIALRGYENNKMHPIMGVVFVIIFVLLFIGFAHKLIKGWDFKIKEYISNHPDITMETLLEDSKKAIRINSHFSIGEKYLFFIENDLYPKVISKADIDYMKNIHQSSGKHGAYYLEVGDKSGEIYKIWTRTVKKADKARRIIEGDFND